MPLNHKEALFLEQKNQENIAISELTFCVARDHFRSVMRKGSIKRKIANIMEFEIEGCDGKIKLRVYQPKINNFSSPVMIFCHGGGFVLGDLDAYDHDSRNYALALNCVVVTIEYRLAPEHKHPTAVDDCYMACKWIKENAALIGGDTQKIIIAGDSSGGNIAANVVVRSIEKNECFSEVLLLIYPLIDFFSDTPSRQLFKEGYNTTAKTISWCSEQYLQSGSQNQFTNLLTLERDLLKKFPKTIVITAEYDPLRDEGEIFYRKLKKEKVRAIHKQFDGTIHGFLSLSSLFLSAQDGFDFISQSVKDLLQK